MSYIAMSRGRDGIIKREMWDRDDIAEYCNIDIESAGELLVLANKAFGFVGYGDIPKDKFIQFYEEVNWNMRATDYRMKQTRRQFYSLRRITNSV